MIRANPRSVRGLGHINLGGQAARARSGEERGGKWLEREAGDTRQPHGVVALSAGHLE